VALTPVYLFEIGFIAMGFPWLFVLLKFNNKRQNLLIGHYEGYINVSLLAKGV